MTVLALAAASAAIAAPTAAFASTSPVVTDCNAHGQLTAHYSVTQLRTALATIPADVEEYTDCYNVIDRALLSEVAGSHRASDSSTQSSSGSFLPTPLIVVIAVLAVAAVASGMLAVRRRNPPGP